LFHRFYVLPVCAAELTVARLSAGISGTSMSIFSARP
jgi:hypothetical protein